MLTEAPKGTKERTWTNGTGSKRSCAVYVKISA